MKKTILGIPLLYPVIKVPAPLLRLEKGFPTPSRYPSLRFYFALSIGLGFFILGIREGIAVTVGLVALIFALWDYTQTLRTYKYLKGLDPLEQRKFFIRQRCRPNINLRASSAPAGKFDSTLAQFLARIPEVEILQNYKLGNYTPDVIVRDQRLGLYICLEVDEPWYQDRHSPEKLPAHWIGKDDARDHEFLKQGWLVIRFAEEQVALQPEGCLALVTQQLCRWDPGRNTISGDLTPVQGWTKEEGLKKSRDFPDHPPKPILKRNP
jgi:very-short-patch-repair endonuclease